MSDSECDAGLNGRCYIDYVCEDGGQTPFCPKILVNDCRYDTCMADIGCGDAACTCREDFPKYTGMNDTCASTFGNCRVDTDCPNGHYCSPSWVPGCFPPAYFCHTSQDECVIDDDCLGETSAFNRTCGFDPQKNHWACMAGCYDGGSGN